jgi:hypothetical protein
VDHAKFRQCTNQCRLGFVEPLVRLVWPVGGVACRFPGGLEQLLEGGWRNGVTCLPGGSLLKFEGVLKLPDSFVRLFETLGA